MTRPMNPARIEARDRRLAAVHEAGHVVVADYLGADGVGAWIGPSGTQDTSTEKSWIGQCSWRRDYMEPRHRRLLAVAGLAAEQVWSQMNRIRADPQMHDIRANLRVLKNPDCMSATDWSGTGCMPGAANWATSKALGECFALIAVVLRDKWLAEARRLIRLSRKAYAPAPVERRRIDLPQAVMIVADGHEDQRVA